MCQTLYNNSEFDCLCLAAVEIYLLQNGLAKDKIKQEIKFNMLGYTASEEKIEVLLGCSVILMMCGSICTWKPETCTWKNATALPMKMGLL